MSDLDVPRPPRDGLRRVRDHELDARTGCDQIEQRRSVRRRLREHTDDLHRTPSFQPTFRTVSRARSSEPRLR